MVSSVLLALENDGESELLGRRSVQPIFGMGLGEECCVSDPFDNSVRGSRLGG